jgi:hypothetical protein
MLNGWKTKHVGTVDHRTSVTGAIIAQGWSLPTGPVAIILTEIAATIAVGTTTVIGATRAIEAIAATGKAIAATVVTIATNEIIATINAENRDIQAA